MCVCVCVCVYVCVCVCVNVCGYCEVNGGRAKGRRRWKTEGYIHVCMYVCIDGWMYIALPEAFKWMGDARYRLMFL